jgi:NADPH:quinone reductase-like Zn-dependent oxidoreductase
MMAAVYTQYGPPEVVRVVDVEKPRPKNDEVLIKVRAASVNPLDWHFMRGLPYAVRVIAGLRRPVDRRLGVDVSGHVEAIGRDVTQFKAGDAVFGSCRGAFAEYACTRHSNLALKPDNVTFEQAASVPVAAYTALQSLRDKARIRAGQKVLINGAAGGVGTFAVQIATSVGADVTGVCSTRNVEMVRSIGASHVIDYSKDDFTKGGGITTFFWISLPTIRCRNAGTSWSRAESALRPVDRRGDGWSALSAVRSPRLCSPGL